MHVPPLPVRTIAPALAWSECAGFPPSSPPSTIGVHVNDGGVPSTLTRAHSLGSLQVNSTLEVPPIPALSSSTTRSPAPTLNPVMKRLSLSSVTLSFALPSASTSVLEPTVPIAKAVIATATKNNFLVIGSVDRIKLFKFYEYINII